MDGRLDRIEEKLDKIVDAQSEMKGDLQEHMRRTQLAEDNIERLALAMEPVQLHVAFIRGLGKLIITIIGLTAGLATVWQVFFNK